MRYIKDGKNVIDPRFIVNLNDFWNESEEVDATPRSSDGQLLFLMEMVSKMKPNGSTNRGSRIASVHNGSSLFTGDAGSGESNIRRYIIENDLLDTIIQMPNNLFYNTGITTYIWLLTNNKPADRKCKVLLIDASQRYAKLRKNLGAKNCEFRPEHIREILDSYLKFEEIPRENEDELAAKVFDNEDFGYYKVTIERPKRLKAQFTEERIETLRFDKTLLEPMQWAWETYGERVYSDLKTLEKEILRWCEEQELDLTAKKRKALTRPETWKKQEKLVAVAKKLMAAISTDEYRDFNVFSEKVDDVLKAQKIKLSASEKNTILNAVSWYDESAEKVIRKTQKLSTKKLDALLQHLGCNQEELPDYGYYPTENTGEFLTYESETDLRDYENIPLKENIYDYFLREVKPHVEEAWIDLDKTKIGYEISFNKYFYRHKPLRSLEEVTQEILELEKENEGLIMDILNVG